MCGSAQRRSASGTRPPAGKSYLVLAFLPTMYLGTTGRAFYSTAHSGHPGPCTFPHFNFSYFYLYKEGNFGSIGNVSRDGILFVA